MIKQFACLEDNPQILVGDKVLPLFNVISNRQNKSFLPEEIDMVKDK